MIQIGSPKMNPPEPRGPLHSRQVPGSSLLRFDAMHETFRLRKTVKYQGMAFAAFFLAVLAGYSSIFFLEEPAKHGFEGENGVAVVGGMGIAVFGAMLLLSIWMWAAYYVERFSIIGTTLSIRSILQNRQFDVSELESLKWSNRRPGGTIFFRVLGSKARLDLQGYSKDDRLRIVRELHGIVPPQVQDGWPLFCYKVALPLRDGKPPIVSSEPSSKRCMITRKRYDRMLVLAFPLSAAIAIGLWAWLNRWQFVTLPLFVIAAWLLLRFNAPRQGRSESRLTSTSLGRAQIFGWSAVVVSSSLMVGLVALGVEKPIACNASLLVMAVAFPPLLYSLYKSDKQQRIADGQAAELALVDWQQGEAAAKSVAGQAGSGSLS